MSQTTEKVKAFTAGEALAAYRRVKINSAGAAVYADADDKADGITESAAASGATVGVRLFSRGQTFKIVAAGAISAGGRAYGADDGKIASSGGPSLGQALEAASNDGDIIEILPDEESSGLLYSNTADSAAITNTVAETDFDKSVTLDGAELKAGDVLEIEGVFLCPSTNSTDTLNIKLKVGTEEICATGAVDVADNDIGYVRARVTIRTAGASGKLGGCGVTALGVPGTVTAKPFLKDEASEDLSGDVVVKFTGTWSVANAANQVTLQQISVNKLKQ